LPSKSAVNLFRLASHQHIEVTPENLEAQGGGITPDQVLVGLKRPCRFRSLSSVLFTLRLEHGFDDRSGPHGRRDHQ
jgi:hypothetical protein